MAVGLSLALLACFVACAAFARFRHRTFHHEPALAATPLHVAGVSKAIDGRPVVRDVNFSVQRGHIVGLLGPNGAGKTTLLRMIAGLAEPDVGALFVFGWQVRPDAPVLSRVGVCIESPGVVPHLTGRRNLETLWAITGRPQQDSAIEQAAELSGLGAALDRRVSGYSLGMRHRLALAQALLGLPDILVLDEPAHGLDPAQILFLRTMLREYAASGRTVVVSSHHLDEIEQTCTDVVVLHEGAVVAAGPIAELTSTTKSLADVYFAAVGDGAHD